MLVKVTPGVAIQTLILIILVGRSYGKNLTFFEGVKTAKTWYSLGCRCQRLGLGENVNVSKKFPFK